MLGCVWPSKHVAFPDFWDPTGLTIKWWISEFARFRNTTISMDGLWMDMDEPTNFGTTTHATYKQYGQKWPTNEPLSCPISGPDSGYDAPPYYTYSGYHNGGFLASVTLCMCGVTVRSNQTFYDTKNLYGLSVMVATAQVQKQAIGQLFLHPEYMEVIGLETTMQIGMISSIPLSLYKNSTYLESHSSEQILLFNAALNGGTVFRPVFFEFPNDPLTYGLSFQFMWGPALIVIPVIGPNATSVAGYLPTNSTWYSMYDYFYGNQIAGGQNNFTAPSTYLIPTFVRGGYILPRQKPSVTTTLSRLNEMQLLITLDTNGLAKGELYWDDGDSVIDDINTYSYYYFVYNFVVQKQNAVLNITLAKRTAIFDLTTLDNLEIFGYPYTPNLNSAKLNGNPVSINTATSSYSPFTKILNITTTNFINLNINRPSWILTWDNQ
uniref:Uncharacterized protein n=1 Tax=Acrobeloides nanus TaxID=290746 RepID=A0A914CID0_9BILA